MYRNQGWHVPLKYLREISETFFGVVGLMMVNFWKIFSKIISFYLLCHFQHINPDHSNVHRLLEPLWSLQWRERVFWCQIEIQLESNHMVLQLWWYIKLNVCWKERSKTFHWNKLNCSPRNRPIVSLLIKSLHANIFFENLFWIEIHEIVWIL